MSNSTFLWGQPRKKRIPPLLTQRLLLFSLLLMAWSSRGVETVPYYQAIYDAEYQQNKTIFDANASWGWAPSYSDLWMCISATISVYEATQNRVYLERALAWAETMAAKATIIDNNNKKNWAGNDTSNTYTTKGIGWQQEDLEAGQEMARLARVILTSPALSAVYGARATAINNFVRDHVVNKWLYTRDSVSWFYSQVSQTKLAVTDKVFLLLRILVDLKLSGDKQYDTVIQTLANGIKDHNGTLPRWEAYRGGLIYDLGKGDQQSYTSMDTAHANRTIFTMIDLYRAGIVFDKTYITGLANLLTKVIWNQSLSTPQFKNFIDGKNSNFFTRGASANGLVYSGWVLLAEFDSHVFTVMDATLKAILAGKRNPSLDYNNSGWGRITLAGHLTKVAAVKSGLLIN